MFYILYKGYSGMSPFDKYLLEAHNIRNQYNALIAANPSQKDQLLSEMNSILSKKLDECEIEEQNAFKVKDKQKEYTVK